MTRPPRCSIVVPVHDHAALTKRCLEAILECPPDTAYEIVVVDDASSDGTRELMADFGGAARCLRLSANSGFATASNDGAEAATASEFVLFLNNDTVASAGWLDALVGYADAHPAAAVVGAKLVYPDGTVQHAGVVIGRDGLPRNLYQGFPGDHPAVNRSRAFQAVTGACMLVRRDAFERVDGFDTAFLNCLEDVDLCLRLRELGHETHYCSEAVLVHYESATRGRRSKAFDDAVRLYRDRWGGKVRADDLDYYAEDGLLAVSYPGAFPVTVKLAPELAVLEGDRAGEVERALERAQRRIFDLLLETVRLSVARQEASQSKPASSAPTFRRDLLDDARRIELEIARLQQDIEENGGPAMSPYLRYRLESEETRRSVEELTNPDAAVLIVSRGDDALLEVPGRRTLHFPQGSDGLYAGHNPATDGDAIAHLEDLRSSGAQYLVFPPTMRWWLEHYDGFARHLDERYPLLSTDGCAVYSLEGSNGR
jgi:GT2 family glycosyltransferase